MSSKAIVFYASKTGNTEKLAKAILKGLPSDTQMIRPDNKTNEIPQNVEVIFLGFWVDKGQMNKESQDFLNLIKNKKLVLFGTLGGAPQSDRAQALLDSIKKQANSYGNEVLGTYLTRGAIDPKIVAMMEQQFPNLANDEKHIARVKAALNHPDEQDLAQATSLANELYVKAIEQKV